MATASGFTFIAGTTPATPSSGKTKLYVDSTTGPSYVDDAGVVHSLKGATGATGPAGPAGNSLARPRATLTSTAGSAVIDLSTSTEVYEITLSENTTITFTNPPASGYVSEGRIVAIQNASAAKTLAFSGTSVKYADGIAFSMSLVLSSRRDIGFEVDSSGNITIYPTAVMV